MSKIVIASDSTCDLSPELIERYGIQILPLGVALGERQYTDGVDIDPDFIYAHYEKTGELPKTSAVNLADFEEFFAKHTADGSALMNFSAVASSKLVGIQPFILAKFDLNSILVMAPIAIAAMMEHIGDVSAISATVGENFIEKPGLHWTLIGDGIATSLSGMFGGPANTTYGENTGVLAVSKVYDPRVVRLAAIYAVILSFSPKFDALVKSIPTAIVGGVSFILYGMISAVGVRNIVENKVDLTKSRNLIIAAVIFVCGLGFSSIGGISFTIGNATITLTSLAIAALAGVVLNAILPGNDYEFGTSTEGDKSADLGSY
jgi:uracil permease